MGRPSSFTQEIADRICELISTSDKGLHTICAENEELPSTTCIMNWMNKEEHKLFVEQYARARLAQADFLADQMIQLSKNEIRSKTLVKGSAESGSFENETDYDNHQRTRLMIDAYKWKASKLAPKKYGEKLDVTSQGEKVNITPPQINIYTGESPPPATNESEIQD